MLWRAFLIAFTLATTPLAGALQDPAPDSPAGKLWAAARRGDAAEVKQQLDAGLDVNTPFRYGTTALTYACDRGHLEVVKLLLERGARVDVRDSFYSATPFDWAMRPAMGQPGDAHVEILKLLLAKGAGSRTALLASGAQSGRAGFVKLALEGPALGALDLADALDMATKAKRDEVAAQLTAVGAKPLPAPEAKLERAVLERYAGEWVSEGPGPQVTVEVGESGLSARLGGDPIPLGAYDERTFRALKPPGARLTFETVGGEAKVLRLTFPGAERVLKRASGRKP
jgi:ankyrin repeat protein